MSRRSTLLKQKKDFNNLTEPLTKTYEEKILSIIYKNNTISTLLKKHQIDENTFIQTVLNNKLIKAGKKLNNQ